MRFVSYLMILVILSFMSGLFIGCSAGRHCISVGGGYEGTTGEIEYCFDEQSSKEAGIPAFVNPDGKSYLIPETDIEKAMDLLEEKTVSISSVEAPITRFLRRIRRNQ